MTTKELESKIYFALCKLGTYLCLEVQMPKKRGMRVERVDLLAYEKTGIWRFYELKVSKSDFHSKNANTFLGNYNYYVMPTELYEQVKDEIPDGIGCYVAKTNDHRASCVKKAKYRELAVNSKELEFSFMQALSRQHEKYMFARQ